MTIMEEGKFPEFHVPSSADDLLSERWKNAGRYVVTNVLSASDLSKELAVCRDAMNDMGMLFILEHFDTLFSVLLDFNKIQWSTLTKAWGTTMQAFRISVKELDKVITTPFEANKQHQYRNATKMIVYLVTQYIKSFEDRLAGCGKGKNKVSKVSESKDWNWKERNHEALTEIYCCLQLPLQNLWDPSCCEDTFSDMIGNACFKSLEDPGVTQVKMKPLCETVFQIIGTLVKKHAYGFSCIVRIGQMLHIHEHMVSPMVRCVVVLHHEFKCTRIVHEVLQEISRIDAEIDGDSEEPTSGSGVARTYGQFLAELAEHLPELMMPHTDILEALLDIKAYAMRCAVLSAISTIVLKCLSGEDLSEEAKEKRDALLSNMEDHILDVNAFVRSKVLQLWQNLVKENAVPISFHASVLEKAVDRLHDKSAVVKKNAVQLVAAFLEQNPFASRLGLEELQAQLEKEERKLQDLESSATKISEKIENEWNELETPLSQGLMEVLDSNSDDSPTDVEMEELDFAEQCGIVCKLIISKDYKSAYQHLRSLEEKLPTQVHCLKNSVDMEELHENCMKLFRKIYFMYNAEPEEDNECKELKRVVAFLKDSVMYVELMNKALPVICALLTSMQTTDIVEAIDFITSAYQFGLSQAENSMRELLTLVLSGNEAVLSAVSEAYFKVYLLTDETDARKHSEIVVKNLCHLVSTVNIGQKAALDSLVLEWLRKGYITSGDIQIMWEWVALAEPGISPDDSRNALVLLDMLAEEKAEMIKTRIPFLLAACLGERGHTDFLLVSITCGLIVKSCKDTDRLSEGHVIFTSLREILREGFMKTDIPNYVLMAGSAIDLIYQMSVRPVTEVESLVIDLAELLSNSDADPDSDSAKYPTEAVSRFLFVVGHVCMRHMIFLEEYVYFELRKRSNKNKRKSTMNDSLKSVENSPTVTQAEDNDFEQIRTICEKSIVTGSGLLAHCSKFVVDICSKPKEYEGRNVLTSAFLTLSKMMLVSSEFCAEHIQLFMTALKTSTDENLRVNCLIAFGDVAFRFPNIAEPWTGYICDSLKDTSSDAVRQTAVLILTHLVMNDMVKIRSQIADIALCLTDPHPEISYTAKVFFHELSQKGNALYNTLPEIISKLTNPETAVEDNKFRAILKFILGLVNRERQLETLIEKLCQRLGSTTNEQQAANVAFCMSLLTYSEKSLYILIENIKCYSDKLHQKPVFDHFMTIVNTSMKNAKQEVKSVSSELESYIQDIVNGTSEQKEDGEDKEADQPKVPPKTPYRRRATRQAASTAKKQPQKGKTPRRRKPKKPSSSESSDLEE